MSLFALETHSFLPTFWIFSMYFLDLIKLCKFFIAVSNCSWKTFSSLTSHMFGFHVLKKYYSFWLSLWCDVMGFRKLIHIYSFSVGSSTPKKKYFTIAGLVNLFVSNCTENTSPLAIPLFCYFASCLHIPNISLSI